LFFREKIIVSSGRVKNGVVINWF